jgi:hypothetical protein
MGQGANAGTFRARIRGCGTFTSDEEPAAPDTAAAERPATLEAIAAAAERGATTAAGESGIASGEERRGEERRGEERRESTWFVTEKCQ